ncbi:ABC transporter permease [Sphaerimonospora thailandensis]|uniref:Transport permease protein n=1 Tax=Sphaerimonospora thailandensis TaxID=795644 RepID=A0A8J3REY7_9ACTN|nr:ABC transporter permease [Sphaerimonospora thailandensis]GIH71188.1 transport permease protein [Sphaerimonospora thailandensis]
MATIPRTARLVAVETKLFLREPAAVFFTIMLPVGLLLALGLSIPDFRKPDPLLGGQRPVDAQFPALMVLLSVMMLALSLLPTTLVTYRERGMLRRMSTTPVRPSSLLAAQLVIHVGVAVAATTLTLGLGHLALDMPAPPAFWMFAGVFVLGSTTLFAIGLCLAAVTPNSRVVQGAGAAVLFPLLFLGGMWLPRQVMPEVLRRISDFTPSGAFGQGLTDALAGQAPQPLHLAVLAGWAVVAGLMAARLFRWQ